MTSKPAPPPAHLVKAPSSVAQAVFNLLNQERAANHLPADHWSPQLAQSAAAHNTAMNNAEAIYQRTHPGDQTGHELHHEEAGEGPESARIAATGLKVKSYAENIGFNPTLTEAGALQLESIMYNEVPPSNGHRNTILSKTWNYVGIAVLIDPSTLTLWLTEDFAALA